MTSLLYRAIAALRVWIGLNDPAENHLHVSHGWLLPTAADMSARTGEPVPVLAPALASAPARRR